MLDQLLSKLKMDEKNWTYVQDMFIKREVHSKTVLLNEGETSRHIHYIKKGCLRQWFNKNGKDITFQFFFEDQAVASIESFLSGQPGMFTLESIEPSTIYSLSKENFDKLQQMYPQIKEAFQEIVFQRFSHYAQLFLSRIRDTPEESYKDLILHHPEIIKRIPQHYIASYLGITPISLSRIRNRK